MILLILSTLDTNLFLDGPSSKSEELTSLLVEDTWDASSFSFSDCSDALDWSLPRSPTGEKGQTFKYFYQKQNFSTFNPVARRDRDTRKLTSTCNPLEGVKNS